MTGSDQMATIGHALDRTRGHVATLTSWLLVTRPVAVSGCRISFASTVT